LTGTAAAQAVYHRALVEEAILQHHLYRLYLLALLPLRYYRPVVPHSTAS
jgi:hypothetical protein